MSSEDSARGGRGSSQVDSTPHVPGVNGWSSLRNRVFGDRIGWVLFLGSVVVFGVGWQVGFFITDTYGLANGLVNVAAGHLEITEIRYSLTLQSQPGLFDVGDDLYVRNYAQLVAAVPILYALRGFALVVDIQLLLVAGWSLAVLAGMHQLGVVLDRRRVASVAGSALAVVGFGVNVAGARAITDKWLPLLALQLLGVLAAALTVVFVYRLVTAVQGRRVGVGTGVVTAVASPMWLWSTVPKRHVLTALLVVVTLWTFYRSRTDADSVTKHALPYVAVALLTWLHSFEGFLLFAALVPADVLTSDRLDRERVVTIAAVFAVALLPFLLTNLAIGAGALTPPRLADGPVHELEIGAGGTVEESKGQAGSADERTGNTEARGTVDAEGTTGGDAEPEGSSSGAATPAGGDGKRTAGAEPGDGVQLPTLPPPLTGPAAQFRRVLDSIWSYGGRGLAVTITEPDRLYHTFVRSGRLPNNGVMYHVTDDEAIDLTLVESTPLLATLVVLPLVARRSIGPIRPVRTRIRRLPPVRQTDLLAVGIATTFTVFYMTRLPLVSQITVRYLLPLVPLGLYGVSRIPDVRTVLDADIGRFLASYAVLTVGFGVVEYLVLSALDPAVGEALQFHALVGLASGGVATGVVLLRRRGFVDVRWVATGLAVPVATATVLYALIALEYFEYGQYVLPVARLFAEALSLGV